MVIVRGHQSQITGVALSGDGRYLASAGTDSIKLWQAQHGEFVRDLPDSRGELPLAWSPDGSLLLTSKRATGYAKSRATLGVRVRAMPSGTVRRALLGVATPLFFDGIVVRTTDGKNLLTFRVADGKLISKRALQIAKPRLTTLLYQGSSPRLKRIEGSLDDSDNARSYAFSRNGKYLVFGGTFDENRARVWDATTGRLLHQVHAEKKTFGLAAVSDDGRYLVTQGENPTWTPPDYSATQSAFFRQFQLHLWDLKTEKIVASWPGYYSLNGGVLFLQFSRDGTRVFCGGDQDAQIRAIPSGKLVREVEASNYQDVSRDDRFWASGNIGNLHISSVATGVVVEQMPGAFGGGSSLAWSPGNDFLASGSALRIWDLRRATALRPSSQKSDYLNRLRWKDAVTLQTDGSENAALWKVNESTQSLALQKRVAPAFSAGPNETGSFRNGVFLSPDGALMLTNAKDYNELGTLYLWDGTGQKLLRKIEVPQSNQGYSKFVALFWLPDSARFLVETRRGLEIWNARQGTREFTLEPLPDWPVPTSSLNPVSIMAMAISPDGKWVAGLPFWMPGKSLVKATAIWNIESDTPDAARLSRVIAASGPGSFSPDSELLSIGAEIWRWKTGDKPGVILSGVGFSDDGSQIWLNAPRWSPDGARLAISSGASVQIFQVKSGRRLGYLATSGGNTPASNDWLMWTPDGYFSAPDRGHRRVRWRENGVLLPYGSPRDRALRAKFLQPALVAKRLSGQKIN